MTETPVTQAQELAFSISKRRYEDRRAVSRDPAALSYAEKNALLAIAKRGNTHD